jgi:hypothetical protein
VLFTNPFVKRSALNSQLTRRFGNGVVCHIKNTQHVYFVNLKTQTRKGALYTAPSSIEEYRIFGNGARFIGGVNVSEGAVVDRPIGAR